MVKTGVLCIDGHTLHRWHNKQIAFDVASLLPFNQAPARLLGSSVTQKKLTQRPDASCALRRC